MSIEGTVDTKVVMESLNKSIDGLMEKVNNEKASKADVAELSKQVNTLKATLSMQGEDSEREIGKLGFNPKSKIVWTKKLQKQWNKVMFDSMDRAGLWNKSNGIAPDMLRKSYLEKVSEYDATGGQGQLQTLVDSIINYLVPIYGVARSSCRVITGIRGSINLNTRNHYPNFGRTNNSSVVRDDGTITPDSPTYTYVTIQPAQSAGIAKVTNKLIYDAVPNIMEDVADQLAVSAGLSEDTELFTGDGTYTYNSFTGLKTATIGVSNQVANVRTGSFTNFDPLINVRQYVAPVVARSGKGKYHMTVPTFALLQTFKASTAGLYFFDLSTNTWKISGDEIVFNQVMDVPNANGTFSIGAVPVIYGDLEKAVVMAIGRDHIFTTLLELYQATSETGYKLEYDFAFGIVNKQGVSRVQIVS